MSDILLTKQAAAPSTPAAGRISLYPKTDGYLYYKDELGVEHQLISADAQPPSSYRKNLMINGGCEVAQRPVPSLGAAGAHVSATMAPYGQVDRFAMWASGGAVSAGSLVQITNSAAGRTGKAARATNVTLTGAGVISGRYRMEARDAVKYKNTNSSFSIKVAHDAGGSINYTVIIRKPTIVDDFTAVTVISTGTPTAVATGVGITLKLENVAMGDCSLGIEVEVQAACGAVTTKNFDFTEWQLEVGAVATDFELVRIADTLAQCLRYLPTFIATAADQMVCSTYINTAAEARGLFQLPVQARGPISGIICPDATKLTILWPSNNNNALASGIFFTFGGVTAVAMHIPVTGATVGYGGYLRSNAAGATILFIGAEL